jgi:IS5 family transposase
MPKYRQERNWSQYNKKLVNSARVELYISEDSIKDWNYRGRRSRGGKKEYSDIAISACLVLKELFKLAYRQVQGFLESLFEMQSINLKIPYYTTLCRRAENLKIDIGANLDKLKGDKIVIAIDSTGLTISRASAWNSTKHKKNGHEGKLQKWRKLHIGIEVESGRILECIYSKANVQDCEMLPEIIKDIEGEGIIACADKAYDTLNCRRALKEKNLRPVIPTRRNALISSNNKANIRKKDRWVLHDRDLSLRYIRFLTSVGGYDTATAMAKWKEKKRYHARSLIETTMWQIKSHCGDRLTNRKEATMATQAMIKCKIVNIINAL